MYKQNKLKILTKLLNIHKLNKELIYLKLKIKLKINVLAQ